MITTAQKISLTVLRVFIGWHFLYEGITKLQNPNWTSAGFLKESKGPLSGFSTWIVSHQGLLQVVDFLNEWGLTAIGLGLILGLFSRLASVSGMVLLLLYYFVNPPLVGLEYSTPMEGSYLVINKTLIEAAALFLLSVFPSGSIAGLDFFISKLGMTNKKVKK